MAKQYALRNRYELEHIVADLVRDNLPDTLPVGERARAAVARTIAVDAFKACMEKALPHAAEDKCLAIGRQAFHDEKEILRFLAAVRQVGKTLERFEDDISFSDLPKDAESASESHAIGRCLSRLAEECFQKVTANGRYALYNEDFEAILGKEDTRIGKFIEKDEKRVNLAAMDRYVARNDEDELTRKSTFFEKRGCKSAGEFVVRMFNPFGNSGNDFFHP